MRRYLGLGLLIIVLGTIASALSGWYLSTWISRSHHVTFEEIHDKYIRGTREEARQALLDEIALVSSKAYDQVPDSRPRLLWLTYCRLYALDVFAGDDPLADADYEQARLWDQRIAELDGRSRPDIAAKWTPLTREQCVKAAEAFDKRKPPRYASTPASQKSATATSFWPAESETRQ